MTDPTVAQIERWQLSLVARAAEGGSLDMLPIGPFRMLVDPNASGVWFNLAIPVEPLSEATRAMDAVREVCRAFRARQRTPHFEFSDAAWPELAGLLELAGFILHASHPQMACAPHEFRPRMALDVKVHMLTSADAEADLLAFHAVRWEGFGEEQRAGPGEIAQMRRQMQDSARFALGRQMQDSARFALGRLDGAPAGTGVLTPFDRVGEIAGVSTLQAFRRRGVAATVTSRLLEEFFAEGGTLAWLDAEDTVARALYSGLGFRAVGTWLSYVQP
jgi:ribosomal protein S18 acetylase RimI-like enzyme